jgi:hypothetical protein
MRITKTNTIVFFAFMLFCVLIISGCSSPAPVACTQEAKICPDGTSVGRAGSNCEFTLCPNVSPSSKLKAIECNDSLRKKSCDDNDEPVCGWFNQSIQCFKYPCASNYGNPCWACSEPQVAYWTEGPCPKSGVELQSECTNAKGNWVIASQECEFVSKEQCDAMNGNFNECSSACRNDPNAEVCTMQCIPVCQFKK